MRSATSPSSLGDTGPLRLTLVPPTPSPDILHPPCQGPVPFSLSSQPLHGPLLSAHSLSICIPSPPPKPSIPSPPSLGDKRARLERVPRSFIPHHMGPKAKSSAKRLNQVCRTKCYELTLWVYNFMPFVAICLSKQPPFHADIQTHTFPPVLRPYPHQGWRSGTWKLRNGELWGPQESEGIRRAGVLIWQREQESGGQG